MTTSPPRDRETGVEESRGKRKAFASSGNVTTVAQSRAPAFWRQSFPFTCGPAALGSVLTGLGWLAPQEPAQEELDLWRETTAIACPGAHPFALALAAHRRGFPAEVYYSGPRPWLWAHIRSKHALFRRGEYSMVEQNLERRCSADALPVYYGTAPPRAEHAGLLLTSARGAPGNDFDPHWIGVLPGAGVFTIADPLRRATYRSRETLPVWWERSGFEATRCWVAVGRPPAGLATPRANGAGDPPPSGEPVHHHHHSPSASSPLERRGWTREEAVRVLESPERRKSQDPAALWSRVGLAEGAVVVDVGAGTGFFALEAARRVGAGGKVYAVDLSKELVELLGERGAAAGLSQLAPVLSTLRSIPLESGIADVVLLANVLHDVPPSTVAEAVRLLKPNGRFVNVDWKKVETPGGPPLSIRLTPDEATKALERHGLRRTDEWSFGPWHYALLLERVRSSAPSNRARKR